LIAPPSRCPGFRLSSISRSCVPIVVQNKPARGRIDYLRIYLFLIDQVDIRPSSFYIGRAQTQFCVVALLWRDSRKGFVEGVVSYGGKEISQDRLPGWKLLGDAQDFLELGTRGCRGAQRRTPLVGQVQRDKRRLSRQHESRYSRPCLPRAFARSRSNESQAKSLLLSSEFKLELANDF
jgi:hypothetical protein